MTETYFSTADHDRPTTTGDRNSLQNRTRKEALKGGVIDSNSTAAVLATNSWKNIFDKSRCADGIFFKNSDAVISCGIWSCYSSLITVTHRIIISQFGCRNCLINQAKWRNWQSAPMLDAIDTSRPCSTQVIKGIVAKEKCRDTTASIENTNSRLYLSRELETSKIPQGRA